MNLRSNFFWPPIALDKTSDTSLRRQIYKEISRAIRGGGAHSGDRLPSTRMLSKLLRVSRNRVLAAYDDLVEDGLICGQKGLGIRVSGASSVREGTLFGLHRVIRAAHYPAKVLALTDPDGNPLYIRF